MSMDFIFGLPRDLADHNGIVVFAVKDSVMVHETAQLFLEHVFSITVFLRHWSLAVIHDSLLPFGSICSV